jgi:hypothetical protein
MWLILSVVLRLAGEKGTWPELWRRLALPVALLVAAGHLSKGLAKLVTWIPFLPGAWRDPAGVETARALTQKTMPSPPALISISTVSWIALILVVAAFGVALREYRRAQRDESGASRGAWPLGVLAAFFAALVFGWRFA